MRTASRFLHVSAMLMATLGANDASAISITYAAVEHATRAQIGAVADRYPPCPGGYRPCFSEGFRSESVSSVEAPNYISTSVSVSSNPGSNSTSARASTGNVLRNVYLDPSGEWWRGVLSASASIGDSKPEDFHSWAAASVYAVQSLQFAVPRLRTGEDFNMEVNFYTHVAEYTTLFSGSVSVEDATTGESLAAFDHPNNGSLWIPLANRQEHEIRVSMTGEAAISGDEGFAGGAEPIGDRDFSSNISTLYDLYYIRLPEPSGVVLLAAALAAIGLLDSARSRS